MECGSWLWGSGDEVHNHIDEVQSQRETHMSTAPETMSDPNAIGWFAMRSVAVRGTHVGRTSS